jgi:hypothetical protein
VRWGCLHQSCSSIQMKDCVCTNHRSSAGTLGEVLPLWPGWKWLLGHLEFTKDCDGKKSSTGCLKQSCLGQCLLEPELCFHSKQLWFPYSFFKMCSKQLVAREKTDWLLGWQSFAQDMWGARVGSKSCQFRESNCSGQHHSLPKVKINIKRGTYSTGLSLTLAGF